MAELLFHGAAGEVTGSMHLVHWNGRWIALDCGLFQGRRAETEAKNRAWPLPPRELAAVVVSHAHIDHTGRLPKLVADGFDGPIYCTPATRDLSALMLPDSAHIQQEDIFYVNKRRKERGLPPVEPLHDDADAVAAIRRMRTVSYDRPFDVLPGLTCTYLEAGHMLGSAGIRVEFTGGNGKTRSLHFSGDVGRRDAPILRDPAAFPPADVVICESTYGARNHEPVADARTMFETAVGRTFDRGGKVIVPAFSVGRTQTVVYYLAQLMDAGRLPCFPVYVDSPLAVNATEVFRLHPECFDAEAIAFLHRNGDLLGGRCVTYIHSVEESKRLNERRDPCVIISASGMCETGRIQHHIKNNIRNSASLILVPGFQAANTLGRKLVDGVRSINLFHETLPVNAEVLQIHGFSGHADQAGLLAELTPLKGRVRDVFLVHGEPEQRDVLAGELRTRGIGQVHTPAPGDRFPL